MKKEINNSFENVEKRASKLPSEYHHHRRRRAECRWRQIPLPFQRLRCADGHQHRST